MRNQSYYAFLFNLNVDMENAAIMKMKGIKGALNLVSPCTANTKEIDPPTMIIIGMNAF